MTCIQIFDPALCCSSGVCGVDPDQQLIDTSADIDWLRSRGGDVERFNLAQEPVVFAQYSVVRKYLEVSGEQGLPLVLVNGDIAMAGRYPSRAELAQWAGVDVEDKAEEETSKSSCGCSAC